MIDKDREALAKEVVSKWEDKFCHGTVVLPTGSGKNFIAFRAISTLQRGSEVLFLYERSNRKQVLLDELLKYAKLYHHHLQEDYDIKFCTYQAACRLKYMVYDMVVADEIHDAMTPTYSNFFKNNYYNAILGLTATADVSLKYPSGLTKGDYFNKYCPIIYTYTTEQAQRSGIQRKIEVHIVNLQLDDTLKNVVAGTSQKPFKTTERKNYDFWNNRFNQAVHSTTLLDLELINQNRLIRSAAKKRADILYKLPTKLKASKELLKHLEKKRVLIFGNSIDALSEIVNPRKVISSRQTKTHNKLLLNLLTKPVHVNSSFNHIASFKMIEQGNNIYGLDYVLIHSYYGKSKSLIQRIGRLRKDGAKIGKVIILRTLNTVEDTWIDRMFKDVGGYKIIQHSSINECISAL